LLLLIEEAIADTHAAIEDHISSKLLKKVEVSGPREVEVSGPRDVEISGIREVEKAPEKHSLHSMIPDLGYEYEGTDGIASAFAGTDTGY